jgi:hypothetical protein
MSLINQLKSAFTDISNKHSYDDKNIINQSALKILLEHPVKFENYINKLDSRNDTPEKEYFTLGSMVDCLLFEPSEYENRYAIAKTSPTGQIETFVHYIINNANHLEDRSGYEHILDEAFKLTASAKFNIDYFIGKLEKEFLEYAKNAFNNKHKTFVSKELDIKANLIHASIQSNHKVYSYITKSSKNELIFPQQIIYFEYKGVLMKAKLDCVKINAEDLTYTIVDAKTSFGLCYEFTNKIEEYGYDFQAAVYTYAMQQFMKEHFPQFKFKGFFFLVESTSNIGYPLVFEMTGESLNKAFLNKVDLAIDDYIFYKENGFKRHRREIEGDFLIKI